MNRENHHEKCLKTAEEFLKGWNVEDAKREVQEEAGVEVGNITYLGSTLINDWRYRGEIDKIKTALFVAKYVFGKLSIVGIFLYILFLYFDDLNPCKGV